MNFRTLALAGPAVVLGLLAIVIGCGINFGPALKGSGVARTETRDVGEFAEIEVGHAIHLDVTVGPETDVVVTGDDNLLPHLETKVSGERLTLYPDRSFSSDMGIKVLVTVPELRMLVGNGATKTTVTGAEGGRFDLELSGASHCQLTGDMDLMEINLSGASHASLTGTTERLTLECSGASHLKAADFKAEKVEAELSGASTAHVYASKEINAEASGASTVRYAGGPAQVEEHTSGASDISSAE